MPTDTEVTSELEEIGKQMQAMGARIVFLARNTRGRLQQKQEVINQLLAAVGAASQDPETAASQLTSGVVNMRAEEPRPPA